MFNLLKHNISQNNLENKIIPINDDVLCYNDEGLMNYIDLDGGDYEPYQNNMKMKLI